MIKVRLFTNLDITTEVDGEEFVEHVNVLTFKDGSEEFETDLGKICSLWENMQYDASGYSKLKNAVQSFMVNRGYIDENTLLKDVSWYGIQKYDIDLTLCKLMMHHFNRS